MDDHELHERLLAENEEYRKCFELHREYDAELTRLQSLRFLTTDEEVRIKDLKKLKLRMKDRMENLRSSIQPD